VLRTTATLHWDLCKEVIYDDDTTTTTTTATSNTTIVQNIENKPNPLNVPLTTVWKRTFDRCKRTKFQLFRVDN
jgi:hypothetical protein